MRNVYRYDSTCKTQTQEYLISSWIVGSIILCAVKGKLGYQAFVHQARADAFIDGLQTDVVGRYYGWEARVVAIIEQLEELFASPG